MNVECHFKLDFNSVKTQSLLWYFEISVLHSQELTLQLLLTLPSLKTYVKEV